MSHYDPASALEEFEEDAALPDPVLVRDMVLRSKLTPEEALELNRMFTAYQQAYAQAQQAARTVLKRLAGTARKA